MAPTEQNDVAKRGRAEASAIRQAMATACPTRFLAVGRLRLLSGTVLRPVTLLSLCALVSIGCPSDASEDAASAHPENDVVPLVVLLPRDAEELDPRFVTDPYGLKLTRLLFASLVTIDPRTLEVVPDLAESIRLEGDRTYHVTLRHDLVFHDGSPLTSEDVVATFEGIVSERLGSIYARSYERIARVEALGPRRVVFELDAPHATFLTDLEVPILPAGVAETRIATRHDESLLGAGPYILRSRSTGELELEANLRWHRGSPRWQRIRFVTIRDDNTRALRLMAGAGDLAMNAVPPMLLPLFEAEPERFEVRSAPGVGTTYLGFHTEAVPIEVRRAIGLAIDREALIAAKLEGRAHVAESWIPTGHWAEVPLEPRTFDPESARRAIASAGWTGRRLLLRTSSDRFRVSIARAIAAMLGEVGLEVDVRPSETATLIADLNRGGFELCVLQVPEVFEPHVLSWFFGSDRIPTPDHPGANRWRLRDAALDEALERGRTQPGREARIAAYEVVQRRLYETLPVLPLWQEDTVAIVRRGVDFDVPRDGRFSTLAR